MFVTAAVMAVPAKKGLWRTIILSDGTEVRAQLKGDEHVHFLQAADGTCYTKSNGTYERTAPETLQAKRSSRLAKRKIVSASTSDGLGMFGKMSMGAVPSIGEYTIPVVMVQFKDLKFKSTTTVEKMTRYYNEEGYSDERGCVGSVRDYFKSQSGGKFIPTFDVVGIVTLDQSYKYYGENDKDGYDKNLDILPGDVIKAAISQLNADFSTYVVPAGDSNHSTGVPLLAMFYAGRGEATEGEEGTDYLWPCEWDDSDDPVGHGDYNGVHFNSFFIGNELYYDGKLMGMGVFCHEFGHALGLPDFYVTDYSYEDDDPFGYWSIMDGGSYINDTNAPIGYTAYEKSYMGWLELKEIGDETEVTLQSPLGTAENSAYIIRNSSTETFIFENRQPGTWYPSDFGTGVLVSRIAYNRNQWMYNTLNNIQSKKRALVLTADGARLNYSASQSNLYGNAKKSIASLKTLSGSSKAINITNIVKNSNGTITITIPGGGGSVEPVGSTLFYESFNECSGKGGNDGSWSGQIANGSFNPDNDGWEAKKAFGANQCAKFGTGSVAGSATTPAFSTNGTAILTFRAGAWNASDDGTTLNLLVSDGTIEPAVVTMKKGEFTDFVATITATGNVTITFETAKGRFFLDEVKVEGSTATAIRTVEIKSDYTNRFYTLDGRYAGNDLKQLSRGLYIVNGKKAVIK